MNFKPRILLFLALWAIGQPVCSGSAPGDGVGREFYDYKTPAKDGTGKVYMGREISFILGHRGIQWLERSERATEERPDLLVELLDLAPADVIADIGAGGGYLTFRIQPEVPEGSVIAVDIQPEMLATVEARRDALKVTNVKTVLGTETDPNLAEESIDAAVMVDRSVRNLGRAES